MCSSDLRQLLFQLSAGFPAQPHRHYLSEYRNGMHLVLATGETDICLNDNVRLAAILDGKQIPHWLDVWGNGTGHDWPWCLRPV